MERSKRRAYIRIVAGAYLGYISYSLLFGNEKEALLEFPWLIAAGVFFMAMAILIVLQAIREVKRINRQEEEEAIRARDEAEAAELAREEREAETAELAREERDSGGMR